MHSIRIPAIASLALLAGFAWAAPPGGAASRPDNEPPGQQHRPPPPVERVLSELSINDQQRAQVRALLQEWRDEAEQAHELRRQQHQRQLAEILTSDQAIAVLAALPPPPDGRGPPPPPAQPQRN